MNDSEDAAYVLWMYGSCARGDSDELSDLDIFIAGQLPNGSCLKDFMQNAFPPAISQYEWSEIAAMAAYGSLFLHHLRLEGRPLTESPSGRTQLGQLLSQLPPYYLFRRDIEAFRITVLDVSEANKLGSTPEFELSVLGTVIRHASVLACYLLGSPCFGRRRAIEQAGRAFQFTSTAINGFNDLYRFRLHEDGRCATPFNGSWKDVEEWSANVTAFLGCLGEAADAFEGRLCETNSESAG
jgi:hypothetical protein